MFDTPVLFLVFNRPEHTRKVFERIREIKPKYLFVAADGPRLSYSEDAEKCASVRSLITRGIDWDCELKTLFRQKNSGCGKGPAEAITWFFDQVEEGIILEDDCLPSHSFFNFCHILLEEYRDVENVVAISGFNFCGEWQSKDYDYFFCDGGNWGWAGWKRAWKLFDFSMSSWNTIDHERKERVIGFYPDFDSLYRKIVVNHYDAWDIQWHYARLYHNGLSIAPALNLVRNIGFDGLGTHTNEASSLSEVKTFEIDLKKKLKGPSGLKIDFLYRNEILNFSRPRKKHSIGQFLMNVLKIRHPVQ